MIHRYLFLAFVLALTGLTGRGVAQSVRDSAGVRIVTNRSVANLPTVFRIANSPSIDVGGLHEDSDYELSPMAILDIYRLPSGEVAVLDGYQLKFFDVHGKFLRSFGRKGEGPGEFQSVIRELCMAPGGAMLAIESTAPRFAVFKHYEVFGETIGYQGMASYGGCLGDGTFIVRLDRAEELDRNAKTARYARVNSRGNPAGGLGVLPVSDYSTTLGREANIVGHHGQVYVGDGRAFEYRVYDSQGHLRRIVRTPDVAVPFTAADDEMVMMARLPPNAPAGLLDQIRKDLRSVPRPQRWPAYTRLSVDPEGRVWISDPPRDLGIPAAWTVFDSTGVLLGRVRPAAAIFARGKEQFRIVRWAGSEVVIMYLDGEGARHVALVPLQPVLGK